MLYELIVISTPLTPSPPTVTLPLKVPGSTELTLSLEQPLIKMIDTTNKTNSFLHITRKSYNKPPGYFKYFLPGRKIICHIDYQVY